MFSVSYKPNRLEKISQNMKKVKLLLDSHSHNSHNLGQMCSYILDIMKECPMDKDNLRKDAKEELDKTTRDDKALKEKA